MKKMLRAESESPLAVQEGSPRAKGQRSAEKVRGTTAQEPLIEVIRPIFRRRAGQWTGCMWPTHFGKRKLDLNGMNSAQARIMARATSGPEAADWRAAVEWLVRVEIDAADAEQAAAEAVALAEKQKWRDALVQAGHACMLEHRHHRDATWRELCEAIAEACRNLQEAD